MMSGRKLQLKILAHGYGMSFYVAVATVAVSAIIGFASIVGICDDYNTRLQSLPVNPILMALGGREDNLPYRPLDNEVLPPRREWTPLVPPGNASDVSDVGNILDQYWTPSTVSGGVATEGGEDVPGDIPSVIPSVRDERDTEMLPV